MSDVLATPAQVSRVWPGAGGAVSSSVSRLLVHHWIPKMSISIWVSCVSDLMDWQSGCGAGGHSQLQPPREGGTEGGKVWEGEERRDE